MGPDFVRAYAPIFAVDRADGPPSAGIDASRLVSEEIDTATGLPAPFIQTGGVREYRGVQGLRGRAMPSYTPGPPVQDDLRGTTDPAYFTDEGGFPLNYYREQGGEPQFAPSQYPGALGRQPEDPPSVDQQRRTFGMAPRVGIPTQVEEYPPDRHVPLQPEDPPSIEQQRRTPGRAPRVGIPPVNGQENLDNSTQSDLDFSSSAPQDLLRSRERRSVRDPSGSPTPSVRGTHPMRSALPFGGNDQRMATIGNLIERFSSIFPRDEDSAGPMARASIPRDPNRALGQLGDISSYPDTGTQQGIAEVNRRLSEAAVALNIQYRPIGTQNRSTQAQERYMQEWREGRRSTRPADRSYHVYQAGGAYRAIDLQPHRLGGIRGPANVGRVRELMIRAGYPDDIEVKWEENPPHYHIEPPERFNHLLDERRR